LPSNAHAYRLFVVKELGAEFVRALLTFVQRRDGIIYRFLNPCQALGLNFFDR
jgi:hypothetical protein